MFWLALLAPSPRTRERVHDLRIQHPPTDKTWEAVPSLDTRGEAPDGADLLAEIHTHFGEGYLNQFGDPVRSAAQNEFQPYEFSGAEGDKGHAALHADKEGFEYYLVVPRDDRVFVYDPNTKNECVLPP